MPTSPTVTLHGLLPPASPTLELACSIRSMRLVNGFTGAEEIHEILRAANGLYVYEWRLATMLDPPDRDRVGPARRVLDHRVRERNRSAAGAGGEVGPLHPTTGATMSTLTASQFRALIDRVARARDSLASCRNGEVLSETETVLRVTALLQAAKLGRANVQLETERRAMLDSVARTARFRMDHRDDADRTAVRP